MFQLQITIVYWFRVNIIHCHNNFLKMNESLVNKYEKTDEFENLEWNRCIDDSVSNAIEQKVGFFASVGKQFQANR